MTTTGPRPASRKFLLQVLPALALLFAVPSTAHAIVKGTPSLLGSYVVRIYAGYYCSGVAIGRRVVATAAHCTRRRMRVIADGASIAVAGIVRSTTLDDGRRVRVTGDAAILRLAKPLPASVSVASVGKGEGNSYTIAGYGTANERRVKAFGSLREAQLVSAGRFALVDPNRSGSIGASACYGDSGGPVLRGSMLVGVISRAAHPSPRIACGDLTRWAPITITGTAVATSSVAASGSAEAEAKREVPGKPAAGKRITRHESGEPVVGDVMSVPFD